MNVKGAQNILEKCVAQKCMHVFNKFCTKIKLIIYIFPLMETYVRENEE